MGHSPGFEGLPLEKSIISKIEEIKKISPITIQIDGAVNEKTIKKLKAAGASIFNLGSSISMAQNPKEEFNKLNKLIR